MVARSQVHLDDPSLRGWAVDSAYFPTGDPLSEALRFCLRYAVLAPSGHNTQPWWFSVDHASVTVGLDPSRGLAVVDPDDREGLVSVGAGAFNLRIALAHFGFTVDESYWPDPHDPDACIRLDVTDQPALEPDLDELFEAIPRRHTNRSAFSDQALPRPLMDTLIADAAAEGAALHVAVDYPTRRALAELVSAADQRQMADKRFRRELASWLRPAYSHRPDGIRGYGSELTELMSVAAPLIVRTFDMGDGRAARDVDLATHSPMLAVLATATDDRTAWLHAGQALARVLLRATAANVSAGFLNQPIEVTELRSEVAGAVGAHDIPQLLLRFGYGSVALPQPRRAVADVVER
jgi:hypothetical protein